MGRWKPARWSSGEEIESSHGFWRFPDTFGIRFLYWWQCTKPWGWPIESAGWCCFVAVLEDSSATQPKLEARIAWPGMTCSEATERIPCPSLIFFSFLTLCMVSEIDCATNKARWNVNWKHVWLVGVEEMRRVDRSIVYGREFSALAALCTDIEGNIYCDQILGKCCDYFARHCSGFQTVLWTIFSRVATSLCSICTPCHSPAWAHVCRYRDACASLHLRNSVCWTLGFNVPEHSTRRLTCPRQTFHCALRHCYNPWSLQFACLVAKAAWFTQQMHLGLLQIMQ